MAPPKPGIVPLRPLFFGEIMDGAFQTIRRNTKTMFGSALIVQAISGALSEVAALGMLGMAQPPVGGFTSQAEAMRYLSPVVGALAGIMGVSLLALALASILQGVMAIPVARSALNRPTGFKQMWSLARSRLWPLVGFAFLLIAGSLLFFAVLFLLAALILTGLGPMGVLLLFPLGLGGVAVYAWIYTKLLVAPAAITIEELGLFAGLRRSWTLTSRNWWRIFGITLFVSFIIGVIGQVIQIPLGLAAGGITSVFAPHAGASQVTTTAIVLAVVSLVVGVLVSAVGFAFQTSVASLIYLDLRMRRDGLDVELLRLLETGEDPDGVPGRRRARQAGAQPWPPNTTQGSPTG
ncbi:glycerophosphoryl diester phosphodiesterase membrane domain-containing protein [Arthrobacter sp. KNU-44]|uniref:glycerophosphoryl diester phosphodiesterase membrane domain-containing protein n=1 Tax=unclassified Arthrobacter TaxID=235627 RepID=UPI003F4388A6